MGVVAAGLVRVFAGVVDGVEGATGVARRRIRRPTEHTDPDDHECDESRHERHDGDHDGTRHPTGCSGDGIHPIAIGRDAI